MSAALESYLVSRLGGATSLGWLDAVALDLESESYAVGAVSLGAHSVHAPHIRQRLYWCATDPHQPGLSLELPRRERRVPEAPLPPSWGEFSRVHAAGAWETWQAEPRIFEGVNGVPARVGRLRAYGNAIVPQVAAAFISAAMECLP